MPTLHKARLLAMAFGAVSAVLLGGCETTGYGTTSYGTTLDTWIGVHSDNLIVTRGPPDRTFALSDGRQVPWIRMAGRFGRSGCPEATAKKIDHRRSLRKASGTR